MADNSFGALVQRALDIAERVIDKLSQPDPINKDHRGIGSGDKTEQHQHASPPVLIGKLEIPQGLVDEHKANREQQATHTQDQGGRDRLRLVVETLTLLSVVIATFFAYRALSTATKSADIARVSLESGQRAFVSFVSLSASRSHHTTKEQSHIDILMNAQWENSGDTPAIDVVKRIEASSVLAAEPTFEQFLGPEEAKYPSGTIGPKLRQNSSVVRKPEEEIVGDALSTELGKQWKVDFNTKKVYLWGWVVYRDIFPNTEPHLMAFCSRLIGVTRTKDTFLLNWTSCEAHNCSDRFCPNYEQVIARAYRR